MKIDSLHIKIRCKINKLMQRGFFPTEDSPNLTSLNRGVVMIAMIIFNCLMKSQKKSPQVAEKDAMEGNLARI